MEAIQSDIFLFLAEEILQSLLSRHDRLSRHPAESLSPDVSSLSGRHPLPPRHQVGGQGRNCSQTVNSESSTKDEKRKINFFVRIDVDGIDVY